uniref:Cyclin I n=1 Tax=Gadus morhua TaxID=8049 RepID=A0A8C5BI98_GADMO
MKFTEPWERQRLCSLLENAVSREAMMWKAYVPKKPSPQVRDTDISPAQRDEAVRWLAEVHGSLQLYPETLALAVSILDRFLGPIKARPKYLRCIAIACFFLAAKTCEEDECVPCVSVLAGSSGCDCTVSEIRRMERVILDKLHWNLHTATPLHFLQIFHALLVCGGSMVLVGGSRSQHLSLLTRRLHHCLADHTLTQVRGSMLALSLISLELESCCSDWLILTIDLLSKAKMDSRELIRCREQLSRRLSTQRASLPPNTLYIYHPRQDPPRRCFLSPDPASSEGAGTPHSHSSPTPPLLPAQLHRPHLHTLSVRRKPSAKRKVEVMEVDDFFDGIKRLYNEESEPPDRGRGLCSVLAPRQEGSVSPCPPLQPIPPQSVTGC